jgi:flagellar hook assembly protein FlgD
MENYPNPFNPETRIVFELVEDSEVDLGIYNLKGQRVRELKIKDERINMKEVVWDGRDDLGRAVASGIYLVRLKIRDDMVIRKIMLIK